MADIDHRVLNSLDGRTISAILRGHLQDSIEMRSNSKGKQREDTVTDAQLALQLYEQDLHACSTALDDRKMAQSMCIAVAADAALIQETMKQEEQATRDRALAMEMSGHTGHPTTTGPVVGAAAPAAPSSSSAPGKRPRENEDAEALAKLQRPTKQGRTSSAYSTSPSISSTPESSTRAASRMTVATTPPKSCTACGDNFAPHDLARVPCRHEYCRTCLEQLFTQSLKDETYFPPRCDKQEIPMYLVRRYLPAALVKEFEARYEELSTKIRTYCHEKTCSAFVPLRSIAGDTATCPKCRKRTCTICKAETHLGDCPQDEALRLLLEAAGNHHWQRCFQCRRVVELDIGCNHITFAASLSPKATMC